MVQTGESLPQKSIPETIWIGRCLGRKNKYCLPQDSCHRGIHIFPGVPLDVLLIEGCEAGQVPYPEDGRQGGVIPSRRKETNGKAVAEVTELDPFEADLLAGVLEIAADHTGIHRGVGVGHDEKLREVLRPVRLFRAKNAPVVT